MLRRLGSEKVVIIAKAKLTLELQGDGGSLEQKSYGLNLGLGDLKREYIGFRGGAYFRDILRT